MAVVFISPKQKQRTFFMGITVIFILFVVIVFLSVFMSKPKEELSEQVFNKPKVYINTTIFDSNKYKNLQSPLEMEIQYIYKATGKDKKLKSGFISSTSITVARNILEKMGLTVTELKEAEVGRDNPFSPY
jgi:hypothetical protein